MFPQIKYRWFPFLAVVVVIALSAVSFIYAWTEPLLSPPDGNVAAPVNVSNNPQTFVDTKTLRVKADGTGVLVIEGGLRSDTFRTLYQSTFATISGNVGIGTSNPQATLHLGSRDTGLNLRILMENRATGDTMGQYSTITSSRLSNGNSSLMLGTTLNGAHNTRLTINNNGLVQFSSIASEPSGSNGSIYYNSGTSKFRCYQGGGWTDCVGGAGGGGYLTQSGSNIYPNDNNWRVGIGTASPGGKLGIDRGFAVGTRFIQAGNTDFIVAWNGNVGIGRVPYDETLYFGNGTDKRLVVSGGSIVGESNLYVQSPLGPNTVVGIGELQTAIDNWPGNYIFGIGWLQSPVFAIGTKIPSGETFGFYGDPAGVYISGNLGIGSRICNPTCQRKVADYSKFTIHSDSTGPAGNGMSLRNADVWMLMYNRVNTNSATIDVRSGGDTNGPGTTGYNLLLNPIGGNVGFGTASSSGSSIILKAFDGANCYRVRVNNVGALQVDSASCPL